MYATAQDMIDRYDTNRLGDLVRDNQTRATSTELLSDPKMATALKDASGRVESAMVRGRRYDPTTDLESLTGHSLALLTRLTCCLAYSFLIERRGFNTADQQRLAPGVQWAETVLDQLANGYAVFTLDGQRDAGNPQPNIVVGQNTPYLSGEAQRLLGDIFPPGRTPSIP